jgi:hypothetical protein
LGQEWRAGSRVAASVEHRDSGTLPVDQFTDRGPPFSVVPKFQVGKNQMNCLAGTYDYLRFCDRISGQYRMARLFQNGFREHEDGDFILDNKHVCHLM